MESQPLLFIENKGQIADMDGNLRPDILFTTHSKGVNLFFTKNGISYQFQKTEYPYGYNRTDDKREADIEMEKKIKTSTYRMDMELIGANPNATIIKEGKTDYFENYYLAHCPNGIHNVASYTKVTYKNIYPNIDWVVYTKGKDMKYDFVVHPGGNPDLIQVSYKDAEDIKIAHDGSLLVSTRLGEVIDQKPISFQDATNIETMFDLNNNIISFKIGEYEKSNVLVIDPSLIWATYYGGSDFEQTASISLNQTGDIYLAGQTLSLTNIAMSGFQTTSGGNTDAFLVKFNSSGSRLWATYYGGTDNEINPAITTDVIGNIFLVGTTSSSSNISFGGFQNTLGGNSDAFLVKFNSSGSRLWATYYGGDSADIGLDVKCDSQGEVYLFGQTKSSNNIAFGGHQNSLGGDFDAFLVKFNSSGNRIWATYYGGSNEDFKWGGGGIDATGNVYLSGTTNSTNNIALGGHQNSLAGDYDAFLVKFNSSGNRIWATYYGGSDRELNWGGVTVDDSSNIYFVGRTNSTSGIAQNGHQNSIGGTSDAFLVKFNSSGNRIWATYYGGTLLDEATKVCIGNNKNIYIAGKTASSTSIDYWGIQSNIGGGADVMIAAFNSNGNRIWGSYYGGNSGEGADDMKIDSNGVIYLAGLTNSTNGISLSGFQNNNNSGGASDVFLAKILYCPTIIPSDISSDGIVTSIDTIISGDVLQLELNSSLNLPQNIQWTPPTHISNASIINPLVYPNSTTNYTATYTNALGCSQSNTITVYVKPFANNGTIGINSTVSSFSLFDTVFIKVELTSANDIYGLFMKLKGNSAVSNYLNYAGYKADTLLGTGSGILSTPPTVSNGVYDFGITKVGASAGYSGSGLFYTLKFVTKNVVIPNGTNFCFYVDDISATNSSGNQVGLTNQGLYCTSFNEQVLVWPGDLNKNKVVTTADILPIGYFYNSTGPARSNASIQWVGQPATLWGYGQGSTNGSAYKVFADANGDGIISNADQTAIGFNIGKSHALAIKKDNHERSGFDGALVLTMTPSTINSTQLPQTNNIKVELKNDNGSLNSFYGISFEIQLDSTIFDPSTATFDYTGSIFGTTPGTDFLKIEYATASTISVGMTRYANAAINGNGLLCNISVKTQPTITGGNTSTIVKGYVEEANDATGVLFDINDDSTYAVAISLSNGISMLSEEQLSIYPNPVNKVLQLQTSVAINEVLVYDALGHFVFSIKQPKNNSIDVSKLSSGVYIAEIKTDNGIAKRRWVKE